MPAIKFAAIAVAALLSAAVPASGLSNDAQMCLVQFVRYNLLRQPFPSKRIFIKLGKRVTLCVLWLLTVSKPISALDCKIASSIRRNAIVSNDQRCFWGNLPSNVDDTITVVLCTFVSWLNPPLSPFLFSLLLKIQVGLMAKSEQVSADHFLLACNPTSIQAIPEAMLWSANRCYS